MFTKHLLDKALITLEVGDSTPLFILLAKDGTIHRKGNGNVAENLPLMRGISQQGHFEALMMTIDDSIFEHSGVLKFPDRVGQECQLTIIFQGAGETDFSFRVIYGLESEGPPAELTAILINAVKISEPWYREQLQQDTEPEKKWWQFWK